MIYQIDYNQDGIAHKDEYVKMFGDCGWEYLQDYVAEVSTSVYEISNITAEKPLKIRCFQLFIIFDNVVPLYYLYF